MVHALQFFFRTHIGSPLSRLKPAGREKRASSKEESPPVLVELERVDGPACRYTSVRAGPVFRDPVQRDRPVGESPPDHWRVNWPGFSVLGRDPSIIPHLFLQSLAEELCHLPFSLNCSSFGVSFFPTTAPMMFSL